MPPPGRREPSTPHALLNALGGAQEARTFLKQLAQAVALGARAHEDAKGNAAAAAAALLQDVVSDVAPALPYVAAKVPTSARLLLRGDSGNKDEQREYAVVDGEDVRAVHVAGDATPVKLTEPGGTAGTFTGRGLWLTEAGGFVELRYSGRWAAQPESRDWAAQLRVLTAEEAMGAWKLEDVVEALLVTLHKQQREEPTQAAVRRTQVLSAIRTLLSAPK
ncbi:hypothetical protein [Pyxidicoccus sp. MSG2]|uniref:hypothetical protein n=1 Tax=Pyxidicoccus sp. MSG2 TaxID=2996790 RepID=UPI002271A65B|nr:hypothetical protein [Pyxidicoccus sp. MSG2]MCY1023955.1 hypothetical protein [Pyxidicoccus sp. MSG2]